MAVSYEPLWKQLADKKLYKEDLRKALGLSSATMAKMSKNGRVSLEIIEKICAHLKCQPGDVLQFVSDEEKQPSAS